MISAYFLETLWSQRFNIWRFKQQIPYTIISERRQCAVFRDDVCCLRLQHPLRSSRTNIHQHLLLSIDIEWYRYTYAYIETIKMCCHYFHIPYSSIKSNLATGFFLWTPALRRQAGAHDSVGRCNLVYDATMRSWGKKKSPFLLESDFELVIIFFCIWNLERIYGYNPPSNHFFGRLECFGIWTLCKLWNRVPHRSLSRWNDHDLQDGAPKIAFSCPISVALW